MATDGRSFFAEMLGGSASREVKVTRAFSACFAESAQFRRILLDFLAKRCECPSRHLRPSDYRCRAEVKVPKGRLDLELTSERPTDPVFRLENKLGDALSIAQMRRYRVADRRVRLVAITKRPPEVGQEWIRMNGCFAARWQEVHELLGRARGLRGGDRFICHAFRDYLEELDMAHSRKLTVKDLRELGRLFRTARGEKRYGAMDGAATFEVGTLCIEMLATIVREVLDRQPVLRTWQQNRPHYFKWRADNQDTDHLAFRFTDGKGRRVGGAFEFGGSGGKISVKWVVHAVAPGMSDLDEPHSIASSVSKAIDPERLIGLFLSGTRKYIVK